MKWFSLIKYLAEAISNWYQEWKPVMEAEKAKREAAEAARNKVVDVPYTEVKPEVQ